MNQLNVLRQIRNQVVHGAVDPEDVLTPDVIEETKKLAQRFAEE
jgi:uncharacterized protein YutE (UPF0331/DUF86 family)